jgi:hypothetical protein
MIDIATGTTQEIPFSSSSDAADTMRARKMAGNITPVMPSAVHTARDIELQGVTSTAKPDVVMIEKLSHT